MCGSVAAVVMYCTVIELMVFCGSWLFFVAGRVLWCGCAALVRLSGCWAMASELPFVLDVVWEIVGRVDEVSRKLTKRQTHQTPRLLSLHCRASSLSLSSRERGSLRISRYLSSAAKHRFLARWFRFIPDIFYSSFASILNNNFMKCHGSFP
jgi:hypothetical protein